MSLMKSSFQLYMSNTEYLLELKHINKSYNTNSNTHNILKDITLSLKKNDYIAIMGESGSGKSTLLHCLGLLDTPDSGAYVFKGKNINFKNKDSFTQLHKHHFGFVFQQSHLISHLTLLENVMMPLSYHNQKKSIRIEKARHYLNKVGLSHREQHLPNQCSGGEMQRTAIARALVTSPTLIFADEPTGALDQENTKDIMTLFDTLNEEGSTIVMITHSIDVAKKSNTILQLESGTLIPYDSY